MEQEKNKICWIRVAKNISYFIAPVLIGILILSIISIVYSYEVPEIRTKTEYLDTTRFADKYFTCLYNRVLDVKDNLTIENRAMNGYYNDEIVSNNINGKKGKIRYNTYLNNFCYLIINTKKNIAYTNVNHTIENSNIENIKREILENNKYWVYKDGKVDTSIKQLKQEAVEYTNEYKNTIQNKDYIIYTSIRNDLPYYDQFLEDSMIYSIGQQTYKASIVIIPITIIALAIMLPIILIGIGKTSQKAGINLTWFDKLPIEIATLLIILFGFIFGGIAFGIGLNITAIVTIMFICFGLVVIYLCCISLLETIVKRIKTRTFIKTTILYWCYKKLQLIFSNFSVSWKVGACFAGFILANWIIYGIATNDWFFGFILLMTLYAFSFIYLLKRAIWFKEITEAIKKMYNGDTKVRIDEKSMKSTLQKVAIHINDIAGGLSNAVNERLKSERLKTELITNVSHDIKTPLTSIINYVDLLKKEEMPNEKAQEYLAVLDNKSQRLKKLTEDLVEASKASSGAIKLNVEKLNVSELIKQVSGEFEDKFKARHLEEVIQFPQNPLYINADSRYMYRVLENMYSNVSKYAMENTRVYTDIIEHGNNVIIQIKNVSKQKLNITAEELMQRFVRGDTSRNTEGSGLGLSIATSLTELQQGKFHIYLDGDLFKITIGFKKATH